MHMRGVSTLLPSHLVDEDDGRGVLPRQVEQRADQLLRLSQPLGNQVLGGDAEEGGVRLRCNSLCSHTSVQEGEIVLFFESVNMSPGADDTMTLMTGASRPTFATIGSHTLKSDIRLT